VFTNSKEPNRQRLIKIYNTNKNTLKRNRIKQNLTETSALLTIKVENYIICLAGT
jgi:hypothetical protein